MELMRCEEPMQFIYEHELISAECGITQRYSILSLDSKFWLVLRLDLGGGAGVSDKQLIYIAWYLDAKT